MAEEPNDRKSPEQLVDDFKALVSANVAGNVQLLARVGALLTQTGQKLSTTEMGRAPDPSAVIAQGIELTLATSAVVNEHTLAMLNNLVDVAERSLATPIPPAAQPAASDPEHTYPLRLEGHRGGKASGQFSVENEYDCPLQLSFSVSPLVSERVPTVPASRVTLEPVELVIAPKAALTVEATVDITEEFVAGETYSARVRVSGFQASDITLQLLVLNPPTDPIVSTSKTSNRTSGTKRGK